MEKNLKVELSSTNFVPPAPPIEISAIEPAASYGFLNVPAGYDGGWHPTPLRQWIFMLSGEMEFKVSSGATHRALPGSAILLEDTSGKGHQSRVLGKNDALFVGVQF